MYSSTKVDLCTASRRACLNTHNFKIHEESDFRIELLFCPQEDYYILRTLSDAMRSLPRLTSMILDITPNARLPVLTCTRYPANDLSAIRSSSCSDSLRLAVPNDGQFKVPVPHTCKPYSGRIIGYYRLHCVRRLGSPQLKYLSFHITMSQNPRIARFF